MILEFISEFIWEVVLAFIIALLLNHYIFTKFKLLLTIFSIFILTILFLCLAHCENYSMEFNSKQWRNNYSVRKKMFNNIINKELLIGKTKQESILLLGKDYQTDGVNADTIFYIVDDNPYGGDPVVMYLKFQNNKVVSVGKFVN
jgi:ABC-type multidrug transport system fused ATPase/permease subunit